VRVRFERNVVAPASITLWSGALAFRTRWQEDRFSPTWTLDGLVGASLDDEGDALRFDRTSRVLRESWLSRPSKHLVDDALLARLASLPLEAGCIVLSTQTEVFSLPRTDVALFDLNLDPFVALYSSAAARLRRPDAPTARALAIAPGCALLFIDDVLAGWRIDAPTRHVRPMGWPETRNPIEVPPPRRAALTALLYDWMVIDGAPRVAPSDTNDPDDYDHLTALRARARSLADSPCDDRDPSAEVARDIAAHTHWSWGFYKLGD
jgi:hypothetical protein